MGAAALSKNCEIVDIGGGASQLVDRLLDRGYERLTVVDVSNSALSIAQARLEARARQVTWVVGDARDLHLRNEVDFWHDRAVFHFLTLPVDQDAYLTCMRKAVRRRGYVLIATYGPAGPEKCSGLPVQRYDAESLSQRLGADFSLVRSVQKFHTTPSGAAQQFTYCLFRRGG